jgi:hypothetical protein
VSCGMHRVVECCSDLTPVSSRRCFRLLRIATCVVSTWVCPLRLREGSKGSTDSRAVVVSIRCRNASRVGLIKRVFSLGDHFWAISSTRTLAMSEAES